MADYETLATYRGWRIVWQPRTGKLFVRWPGLFGPNHDFRERPRSRIAAIEIAKAWIDRRR